MFLLVALLGHTNKPTCGVEDYCTFLGRALAQLGIRLDPVRTNWFERGWIRALLELWRKSADWRGGWVLLQYTAGAWSRYGFPFGALGVVTILRLRDVRCAMMFHEPYGWEVPPANWIDRVRGACQDWVIRNLYRYAAAAIFADPLETISWLPKNSQKAAFIPIGGNIPEPVLHTQLNSKADAVKTVAVFCLSDPPRQQRELDEISHAMRLVSADVPRLRLVLLGRGTTEAQEQIDHAFQGIPMEIANLGIQSADEISRTLAQSDAMLCVRGRLFARRGSALAGIACGVPIIAYAGPAQQTPLAEAGVEFVPYGDRDALGAALARVLTDEKLQAELRSKSRRSQENYFSWNRIASRHVEALRLATATAISPQ
jgi:glycosyltransferase involved in cell wall biosynthesis